MNKGIYNKFWNVEEVALLKFWYPKMTNVEIGNRLSKKEGSIIAKAFKLRLIKDKDFIIQCSKKSQFKPGNKSFNKGRKQTEYMSLMAIERTKVSRFKKGNIPFNTRESDGEISVRRDTKTGIEYLYIRVSLGQWELLQRVNYRNFIGEIPDGYVVILRDGNSKNCCPTNLELITQKENMIRNTIHRYPPELISTMKALSKLKKTIKNKL